MKKIISSLLSLILMVMLMSPQVFAISKNKALKTAKKNVPNGAILKDTDKKGTFYEFEFINKSKTKEYTVLINAKNRLQLKEVEVRNARGGASIAISTSKALSAVKKAFKGVTIYNVVQRKHNGWVYTVSFKKDTSFIGIAEVNAKSGQIIEWKKVYKRAGLISPFTARKKLLEKVSDAKLIDIDLDYEDKRWTYDIEVVKGAHQYELEINAKTGAVIDFDDD